MQKFSDLKMGKGKLPDDVVGFLLSEGFIFSYNKRKMYGQETCVFVLLTKIEEYTVNIDVSKTCIRCIVVNHVSPGKKYETEIGWDGKNLIREYERILEFIDTTILEE